MSDEAGPGSPIGVQILVGTVLSLAAAGFLIPMTLGGHYPLAGLSLLGFVLPTASIWNPGRRRFMFGISALLTTGCWVIVALTLRRK